MRYMGISSFIVVAYSAYIFPWRVSDVQDTIFKIVSLS